MALRAKFKWTAIFFGVFVMGLQFTTSRHSNPSFNEAQTLQGATVNSGVYAPKTTPIHHTI